MYRINNDISDVAVAVVFVVVVIIHVRLVVSILVFHQPRRRCVIPIVIAGLRSHYVIWSVPVLYYYILEEDDDNDEVQYTL